MHRSIAIFLDELLRDQNRVLEIVAAPGHEGDQNVLTKGQLAPLGRGTISDNVAAFDPVPDFDDGFLVQTGVLVRAGELDQIVDIDARSRFVDLVLVDLHDDAGGIDTVDDTIVAGRNR
jgi:23S rRNA U2552 (ribose-2'-O)-methylase RlmE/FtsJ